MKFSLFSRFLLVSLILLLAGCNHKEFCYNHPPLGSSEGGV